MKLKTIYFKCKFLKQNGGTLYKDIIFIAGRGGVGKTTVANTFKKQGYYLISLDEIIRKNIIKEFGSELKDSEELFWIYVDGIPYFYEDKENPEKYLKEQQTFWNAKKRLVEIVRKKINKHKKVVIEGCVSDHNMIRNMFKDYDFTFLYVQPSNVQKYEDMIIKRFKEDPNHYGRLIYIKVADVEGIGLKKYNEGDNTIIKEIIHNAAKKQYELVEKLKQKYGESFNVETYVNDIFIQNYC